MIAFIATICLLSSVFAQIPYDYGYGGGLAAPGIGARGLLGGRGLGLGLGARGLGARGLIAPGIGGAAGIGAAEALAGGYSRTINHDSLAGPGVSTESRQQDPSGNYAFGYDESHTSGGSSRQESGDALGNKAGQYTITDADGRQRIVRYVADELGFRASVETNEPGTGSEPSAAVSVNGNQGPIPAPDPIAAGLGGAYGGRGLAAIGGRGLAGYGGYGIAGGYGRGIAGAYGGYGGLGARGLGLIGNAAYY